MNSAIHHSRYSNTNQLLKNKVTSGLKISVIIPTFNESQTIGQTINIIQTELIVKCPLVDEIIVIDGNSTDNTIDIAQKSSAKVFSIDSIMPTIHYKGKGTALWKSQFVSNGDILVCIDADIKNFSPKFITGLVGPLLEYPEYSVSKARYRRPLKTGSEIFEDQGGRVTEILVRPLLSLFTPELAKIAQPLSGEYAMRRTIMEQLPFSSGYGVEIGLLLDIFNNFGLHTIVEIDLEERYHRNRSVQELGKTSFSILQTVFKKFDTMNLLKLNSTYHLEMQTLYNQSIEQTLIEEHEIPAKLEFTSELSAVK